MNVELSDFFFLSNQGPPSVNSAKDEKSVQKKVDKRQSGQEDGMLDFSMLLSLMGNMLIHSEEQGYQISQLADNGENVSPNVDVEKVEADAFVEENAKVGVGGVDFAMNIISMPTMSASDNVDMTVRPQDTNVIQDKNIVNAQQDTSAENNIANENVQTSVVKEEPPSFNLQHQENNAFVDIQQSAPSSVETDINERHNSTGAIETQTQVLQDTSDAKSSSPFRVNLKNDPITDADVNVINSDQTQAKPDIQDNVDVVQQQTNSKLSEMPNQTNVQAEDSAVVKDVKSAEGRDANSTEQEMIKEHPPQENTVGKASEPKQVGENLSSRKEPSGVFNSTNTVPSSYHKGNAVQLQETAEVNEVSKDRAGEEVQDENVIKNVQAYVASTYLPSDKKTHGNNGETENDPKKGVPENDSGSTIVKTTENHVETKIIDSRHPINVPTEELRRASEEQNTVNQEQVISQNILGTIDPKQQLIKKDREKVDTDPYAKIAEEPAQDVTKATNTVYVEDKQPLVNANEITTGSKDGVFSGTDGGHNEVMKQKGSSDTVSNAKNIPDSPHITNAQAQISSAVKTDELSTPMGSNQKHDVSNPNSLNNDRSSFLEQKASVAQNLSELPVKFGIDVKQGELALTVMAQSQQDMKHLKEHQAFIKQKLSSKGYDFDSIEVISQTDTERGYRLYEYDIKV